MLAHQCLDAGMLQYLSKFLHHSDLWRLSGVDRFFRAGIRNEIEKVENKDDKKSTELFDECGIISLPSSYANIIESDDGSLNWGTKDVAPKPRLGQIFRHLILDSRTMQQWTAHHQKELLDNFNFVETLIVKQSFFLCRCSTCSHLVDHKTNEPSTEPNSARESSAEESGSNGSPRESADPERLSTTSEEMEPRRDGGELAKQTLMMRHAWERLSMIFLIIFRNSATLRLVDLDGPPRWAATALIADKNFERLPLPMRQRGRNNPTFPCVVRMRFGATVDCRHIVPFLDYHQFDSLTSITIGRLTAEYRLTEPQFGKKSFIIFAPQHLFDDTPYPSAPHLPALYNGDVDELLRFQGRGLFVCDEYSYEGHFLEGVNHGMGHMTARSGEKYFGQWKTGQRTGKGRVIQINGDVLTGDWVHDSLTGLGQAETPTGFQYCGQWMGSNFNGWGSIWYRGNLMAYGRFNHGYFTGWNRCLRYDPKAGLMWEESDYDELGYVLRCYHISLKNPTSISAMPINNIERVLTEVAETAVPTGQTPLPVQEVDDRSFAAALSSYQNRAHGDRTPARFLNAFPDEESPWASNTSSPLVMRVASNSMVDCPLPSPACRARMVGAARLLAQETSYFGNPSPPAGDLGAIAAEADVSSTPNSPWSFRQESLGSSLAAEDSPVILTNIPLQSSASVNQEVALNEWPAGLTGQEHAIQVRLGSDLADAQSTAIIGTRCSRSKIALLQCSETVEAVLDALHGDEVKAHAVWEAFSKWNSTFFRRIHCDWLVADNPSLRRVYRQQGRLASPLEVPVAENVPIWFRNDITSHFGYALPGTAPILRRQRADHFFAPIMQHSSFKSVPGLDD